MTKSYVYGMDKKAGVEFAVTTKDGCTIEMMRYKTPNGYLVIPNTDKQCDIKFVLSNDFQKTYVYDNQGIWQVGANSKKIREISHITKQKYDELIEVSEKKYGSNYVVGYDEVLLNKDNSKIVYLTNRYNLEQSADQKGIVVVDLKTGKETNLTPNMQYSYYPVTWLDDERVLVRKSTDDSFKLAIVDVKGNENEIKAECAEPYVHSSKNEYIAYMAEIESKSLWIGQVKDNSLATVSKIDLPGRMVEGLGGFSKDMTKFMTLYYDGVGDKAKKSIYVYDLLQKKGYTLKKLPDNNDFVEDCFWFNDNQILAVLAKGQDDKIDKSSWLYILPQ